MASNNRVVVIGAGHNGLVTAYYLAKAGFRPLVLERREVVGGCAVTEEIHPGFHCPTLAHSLGPLATGLADELQLAKHGLELIQPEAHVFAPSQEGRSVCLYANADRTTRELGNISNHDAKTY